MKCPHCQTEFHDNVSVGELGEDRDAFWYLESQRCPACERLVLQLVSKNKIEMPAFGRMVAGKEIGRYFARPKASTRPNPPSDVPLEFAQDYIEGNAEQVAARSGVELKSRRNRDADRIFIG